MKLADAVKFIDMKISELEKDIYVHDMVIVPRVTEDRKILRMMRDQRVKMAALLEKVDALNNRRKKGEIIPREEEISTDELRELLPEQFRG